MTRGPICEFLESDHARLDALLQRSDAGPELDLEAYASFREGLLRHIAMEEKVLLVEARRLRGGEPLPLAKQLRADHALLAALLVPTPTHGLIAAVRRLLAEHNPLEEGPGGLYDVCEQIAGAQVESILARIRAMPEVPVARHCDHVRVFDSIERLMRARKSVQAG